MAMQSCMGATTMCSMGVAPSSMVALPLNKCITPMPAANIADAKPFLNITPMGMCMSVLNPAVAAATIAAAGVLTPMPCTPVPLGVWLPGSLKCFIGVLPALDHTAKSFCAFGGVIQQILPGQFKVLDG